MTERRGCARGEIGLFVLGILLLGGMFCANTGRQSAERIASATATPRPSVARSNLATDSEWRSALTTYLTTTVCSPTEDPAYPQPAWCGQIAGASLLGGMLTVTTTATDKETGEAIGRGLATFAYGNRYKAFGIETVRVVSEDGTLLFERRE